MVNDKQNLGGKNQTARQTDVIDEDFEQRVEDWQNKSYYQTRTICTKKIQLKYHQNSNVNENDTLEESPPQKNSTCSF